MGDMQKQRMYKLLKNHDNDLPYCCNVNEQRVLDILRDIEAQDGIDEDMRKYIEQWILFNKALNEYEIESYLVWVACIYSDIAQILSQCDLSK